MEVQGPDPARYSFVLLENDVQNKEADEQELPH